jgi:hypothetical protein
MKIEGKTESDSSSGGESLSSPEKYFSWWSNQLMLPLRGMGQSKEQP